MNAPGRRLLASAAVGVAAVLVATGCTFGGSTSAGGDSSPAGTSTASGAPLAPSDGGPSGGSTGDASPTKGPGSAQTKHYNRFQSPSGNIACDLRYGAARCDIADHSYKATGKPADCDGDWGSALRVGPNGSAGFQCASDTVADPGDPKLPYGATTTSAGYTCTSKRTGITCRNGDGRGFTVSRETYTFF